MKTILITGGCGYIASHFITLLDQKIYKVVIVDNFFNSSKKVLENLKKITSINIKFYEINIVNKIDLQTVFSKHSIDIILHFAGLKYVDLSFKHKEEYYKNNVMGSISLLELALFYGVKKIIFSSSASVYGLNNISPIKETSSPSPISPYAENKLHVENILNELSLKNPELTCVSLRYFNPIGAHESGLLGERQSSIQTNIFPILCSVARGEKPHFFVYGNDYDTPDGTCIRDYIHISDLCLGHIRAMEFTYNNFGNYIFNLGTGKGYSVLDFIKTFEKITNLKIPVKLINRRDGDISQIFADTSMAKKYLNWVSKNNLDQMIFDGWNWEKTIHN